MSTKRVVIVGGKVAELSTPYTLMKRGTALLLIEAEDQVGGGGRGET